jgi:UDP-N-acetylglucosamine 2-epimerase (non-hydrolysing)
MTEKPIKVLSVFGTRPEAIKMAPLVIELKSRPEFDSLVCVTAQHRQMLDGVLSCFSLQPDYDLDIMQQGQTLSDITSRVLYGLGGVLGEVRPDIVLVHGDTTTAFASALAAFYAKISVGHVEAGLRTCDIYSPYPEEMNRSLIGRIAEYNFAPTAKNAENLRRENAFGKIFITGNTVIDAMKYTIGDGSFSTSELNELDYVNRRVITLTCHRRENYGQPMENIFSAVRQIAEAHPEIDIVYPVHLSPYVRETAKIILGGTQNIHLIEPLDAAEMHRLLARSYFVMTDSGGLQEEAPALGKPVLVLRCETERPEAVSAGTVKLAGVESERIVSLATELLSDSAVYQSMAQAVNPYGDGCACGRIAEALLYGFGRKQTPPEEFRV